jgi:alginate O-acetyltransferase complex protein AlgI
MPRLLRIALTMVIVLVAWVFFRAENISHAIHHLGCMFGAVPAVAQTQLLAPSLWSPFPVLLMGLCAVLVAQPLQSYEWAARLSWPRLGISAVLFALAVATMYTQSFNPFLYFQF